MLLLLLRNKPVGVNRDGSVGTSFAIRLGNERHIHAPADLPTEDVPQKVKKQRLVKRAPDAAALAALKGALTPDVQLDPHMEEDLKAARLLLEQDRAERIRWEDEEQAQIALVIAMAQRRRHRFTWLSA